MESKVNFSINRPRLCYVITETNKVLPILILFKVMSIEMLL